MLTKRQTKLRIRERKDNPSKQTECSHYPTPRLIGRLIKMTCIDICGGNQSYCMETDTNTDSHLVLYPFYRNLCRSWSRCREVWKHHVTQIAMPKLSFHLNTKIVFDDRLYYRLAGSTDKPKVLRKSLSEESTEEDEDETEEERGYITLYSVVTVWSFLVIEPVCTVYSWTWVFACVREVTGQYST